MLLLEQIPMRRDNYSYAIIKGDEAIIIDPSTEEESLAYFEENSHLRLKAIINTHGHMDHVGGNEALYERWRCPVYGPKLEQERIPCISHKLENKAELNLLGLSISIHDVKAHTKGHIAVLLKDKVGQIIKHGHGQQKYPAPDLIDRSVMFVGDSLFAAGCGRLFEGTRDDLLHSLEFYARQDPDTLMACAHEYTKANLAFAHKIFPDSVEIKRRQDGLSHILSHEGSSVPCTFAMEHKTNPFLLALQEPYLRRLSDNFSIDSKDLSAVVGELRKAKDHF